MTDAVRRWYDADKDAVHSQVWEFVRRVETEQSDSFQRIARLEAAYDPHSPAGDELTASRIRRSRINENMIASGIDTVYAAVATAEVRARFMTDNAEWSVQRRAKKLEYYAEGLAKLTGVHRKCRIAFKECAKKGNGAVKVYADRWGEIRVDHVPIDEIVVPDSDARSGAPPLQLHHVQRNYDRDQLLAEYPEHKEEIEQAFGRRYSLVAQRGGASFLNENKLTVIESIRLPIGKRRTKGKRSARGAVYVPGRRTITIETATLLDEPYHKPYYPLAMIAWSDRQGSFYAISGAERIASVQDSLNRFNNQVDLALERNANPTTFVKKGDFNVAIKTTKIGNMVPIKGDLPTTQTPPAVHPEIYQERARLRESAFEQLGVSRLAAQSKIPAGLETGAAVREYRDQTTQRFAPQEADFEALVLDAIWLVIDACKDLGADAPTVLESRWKKPIEWSQVDMGQVRIQIEAASTLPRSPAGREQTVLEWAQAGIISTDSAKRLIDHPDLERELSLYTSALDSIDQQLEEILDGGISTPEPFDNAGLAVWRGTATFNNSRIAGAPEEVLETLADYITYAGYIFAQQKAENENGAAGAAAGPEIPGAPGSPPTTGQPTPALSAQAMQLMAG